MAKKKTNGFHLFANSKRAVYEARLGRKISLKMLLELSAHDWKNLSVEEQTAWLSKPKSAARAKISTQEASAQQPKPNLVQHELMKRTYKTGLDRQTAREEFYGNLLWREKDRLGSLLKRKWALVVMSPDGTDIANDIVCVAMDKGKIENEMRIRRVDAEAGNGDQVTPCDLTWDLGKPSDVNEICMKMNAFLNGSCNNYILVPAHQQPELAATLNFMKQTRDTLHNRETQSIRLDRLVCLEDAVQILRLLNNYPQEIDDLDQRWAELCANWQNISVSEYARSVSSYFLSSQDHPRPPGFDCSPDFFSSAYSPSRFSHPNVEPVYSFHPKPYYVLAAMKPYPSVDPVWMKQDGPKPDYCQQWTRTNPFCFEPQTSFASANVMDSVTNWLDNLTLDASSETCEY